MLSHFNFPASHLNIVSYLRLTNIHTIENILQDGEGTDSHCNKGAESTPPPHLYKADGTLDEERYQKYQEKQKAKREVLVGIAEHIKGGVDR